jgi:endonuclease/exonuclease/phosphatase family metal-dependent hydrolase
VYWPGDPGPDDIDRIARGLVAAARVPLVLAAIEGRVLAWTRSGRFRMPEEANRVLPADHPFLQDAARDLSRLCTHPDAGTFLISGWRGEAPPLSFVSENGAHGGPGPNECSGFAMLPADITLPPEGTFRPGVLRGMAQRVLKRRRSAKDRRPALRRGHDRDDNLLRIVTYNIHGCIGLDGRLSPSRIARVLAMTDPDIVALQEVDVRRDRSGLAHQAELIAHALEMELDFHPSFEIEEGQYGNAILSRLPMRRRRAAPLPRLNPRREPRAALWVEVDVGGPPLHVVMAHLGTSSAERLLQIDELLGPCWLEHPECREPLVLCGDFNVLPGSRVYRRLARRLRDVQTVAEGHHPLRTWFGPFPLTRIDHVFIGEQLRVRQVHIPRTSLARVASDHLPLGVDLEILPDRERAAPDRQTAASAV